MTYPAAPASVERQVTGRLEGVEQKNAGWMRFSIREEGKQYPYKADTKKADLIAQLMSLMGQVVTIQAKEQQSTTINEHTNEPYVNKWLNSVAVGGAAPGVMTPQQTQAAVAAQGIAGVPDPALLAQQPQPQPQAQPAFQPGLVGAEKDLNIARQCGSKVAVMMLANGLLPEEQRNMEGLIEAAEAWMAYYFLGPLRFGVQPFLSRDETTFHDPVTPRHPAYTDEGQPEVYNANAPADWGGDPGPQDGYDPTGGQ